MAYDDDEIFDDENLDDIEDNEDNEDYEKPYRHNYDDDDYSYDDDDESDDFYEMD